MSKKKDQIEETQNLPEEEAIVAEPALDAAEEVETVVMDDVSLSDEPVPAAAEEPAAAEAADDAIEDVVIAEPLAVEDTPPAPEPAEEKPAPGYGAPQMLYEDFIPFEYLHASDEKPEKPAPEEAKPKKEKPKKPTKEDELLAEVEAEMASREAEPAPAADATAEEAVVIKEVPVEQAEIVPVIVPEEIVKEEPVKEETVMAKKKEKAPKETREFSAYEKRLRRKYKLDKDVLLTNNDVIPGFVLAKGENVVRSYNCLASKKGDGTLCLTNKRLMINTDERSEVAVNMVTGVKFAKNTYFSFAKFLFGLLFLVLGAAMLLLPFFRDKVPVIPYVTDDHWKDWFKYLFIACGAVSVLIWLPLWFTMVKKFFYFTVFVNEGAPFLECKSKSFVKSEKKGKQYNFVVTNAGKDSEKAARELGALILEVKEGRYDF